MTSSQWSSNRPPLPKAMTEPARPHIGRKQINRFRDTFIGPRDITFHRSFDIAVLRYDLDTTGDVVKIDRLRAYWELPTMMLRFARLGTVAVPAGIALTSGLLRHQKLSGTLGFAKGFRSPGRRGKAAATTFLQHLAGGQTRGAASLLRGEITTLDGELLTVGDLADRLRGAVATRVIASGPTVVISTDTAHGRAVLFIEFAPRQSAIDNVEFTQNPM